MPFDTPPAIVQPAPESIGAAPYVLLFAGQGADLSSTIYAKRHGLAEGNPFVGQSTSRLVIAKSISAVVISLAMRTLDKQGHERQAKWIGYLTGAVLSGVAAVNMRKATR